MEYHDIIDVASDVDVKQVDAQHTHISTLTHDNMGSHVEISTSSSPSTTSTSTSSSTTTSSMSSHFIATSSTSSSSRAYQQHVARRTHTSTRGLTSPTRTQQHKHTSHYDISQDMSMSELQQRNKEKRMYAYRMNQQQRDGVSYEYEYDMMSDVQATTRAHLSSHTHDNVSQDSDTTVDDATRTRILPANTLLALEQSRQEQRAAALALEQQQRQAAHDAYQQRVQQRHAAYQQQQIEIEMKRRQARETSQAEREEMMRKQREDAMKQREAMQRRIAYDEMERELRLAAERARIHALHEMKHQKRQHETTEAEPELEIDDNIISTHTTSSSKRVIHRHTERRISTAVFNDHIDDDIDDDVKHVETTDAHDKQDISSAPFTINRYGILSNGQVRTLPINEPIITRIPTPISITSTSAETSSSTSTQPQFIKLATDIIHSNTRLRSSHSIFTRDYTLLSHARHIHRIHTERQHEPMLSITSTPIASQHQHDIAIDHNYINDRQQQLEQLAAKREREKLTASWEPVHGTYQPG